MTVRSEIPCGNPTFSENLTGWIICILFLAIYLACPTIRPNHDAVGWSIYLDSYGSVEGTLLWPTVPPDIEAPDKELSEDETIVLGERQLDAGWWVLLNPHHLFYLPVTAGLFRAIRHLVPALSAMTFLQIWNSVISALTLMLLYRLLARVLRGSPYVIPWILFLGSSITFFHYATDGAQYPSPVIFLALASENIWCFGSDLETKRVVRAGLWLALAVLFHQIVSIIVPFFSLSVYLRLRGADSQTSSRSRWISWIPFLIGMGIPVIVYLIVGAFALVPTGEFTISGIFKYATLYAREKEFWSGDIITGVYTNLLTYLGFFFGNPRTQSGLFDNVLFTLFIMLLPAFWVMTVIQVGKIDPVMRWWAGFNALWILPLLIFLSFWVPGNDFYHLFLSIPLSFLALMGIESVRRTGREGVQDIALFWGFCFIGILVNVPFLISQCRLFAG